MSQAAPPPRTATSANAVADASAPTAVDEAVLTSTAQEKLTRAIDWLVQEQNDDGHWCAELEGDSILQSEFLLLKWILGQEDDPRRPKIVNYLRQQQRAEDGAWVQYPGGAPDISACVKGYFCLKLAGDDVDAPHMRKARELILSLGGAEKINSFSKFYLACLGQVSYSAVPSIPPELVYLPKWFYFHMDKVSAWTRTMIAPLSIVTTLQPVRELSEDQGIGELFVSQRDRHRLLGKDDGHPFWQPLFLAVDKMLKGVQKLGMTPWRKRSLKYLEDWILEHWERSHGIGAIFPPMVYSLVVYKALGYAEDHPAVLEAHKRLEEFFIEEGDTIRIQPCFSPVWDTGIAAYALTDAGLDGKHPALARTREWLLAKECREPGDWVANVNEEVEPSGWFFEYENGFYPDVDDTAMVAMALKRIGGEEAEAAADRGLKWALAMQNDDGGWAAFDRTVERPILEHVPFADHNAIQDPSCPDITGRTLESLSWLGYTKDHPKVAKAIDYVKSKQEYDGCWFGRWGVNYIYGTWQSIGGMRGVGVDMSEDWVQRAGQWYKRYQKDDGSFGESCDTYEDPSLRGTGESTASQTAWAVMGMMTIYGPNDPAVYKGIQWLCEQQLASGTWDEQPFTGTGFPRVFYLRYHLYRHYFPLMAIGRWLRLREQLPASS